MKKEKITQEKKAFEEHLTPARELARKIAIVSNSDRSDERKKEVYMTLILGYKVELLKVIEKKIWDS